MNVADTEALLAELSGSIDQARVEVGTMGDSPHDYAYLKLISIADPNDYATISSPGDRWFTLAVPGGFAHNEFSEFNDNAEVRRILEQYVVAGSNYLEGLREKGESRFLHTPYVTVTTGDRQLKLQLGIRDEIKHLASSTRPRGRE